jgi:hypothetical protein
MDKDKASQYPVLVRNDYALGFIIMEEMSLTSRRSGFDTRQYYDVHTVVKYKQNSNNSIDEIVGTQENKGQLQDTMPIQIKRLIHQMKRDFMKEVLNKKKEKVEKPKKPAKKETFRQESPIPEIVSEPMFTQVLAKTLVETNVQEPIEESPKMASIEIPAVHVEPFIQEIPVAHVDTYIEEIHVETCEELQECQAEILHQKECVASQKETPEEKNLRAIQKIKEHLQKIMMDLKESELQRQTIAEEPKHSDPRRMKCLSERIGLLTKQNQDYVELLGMLE